MRDDARKKHNQFSRLLRAFSVGEAHYPRAPVLAAISKLIPVNPQTLW